MAFSSDDERRLFEMWGWACDHVKREWRAPCGTAVSFEELMRYSDSPEAEGRLVGFVMQHGRREVRPE